MDGPDPDENEVAARVESIKSQLHGLSDVTLSPFWKGSINCGDPSKTGTGHGDSEAIAARVVSPVPKNKLLTGPNGAEHACCTVSEAMV